MKKTVVVMVFALFIVNVMVVQAAEFIGIVRSVTDDAYIFRGGEMLEAETNLKILNGDVIKTGSSGSLGLIFEDDTVVSMGPDSEFAVENFQFKPAEKKLSLVVRMFKGTFAFLSGQITKLAPEAVQLETPDATIGMRGTHVLVKVAGG